jgi:hypothetical protein
VAEEDIQDRLESYLLTRGAISLRAMTVDARIESILDLVNGIEYRVFKNHTGWNREPKAMVDLIGQMIPDLVLRSAVSGENRIYIEVKETSDIDRHRAESQVVRYFLHLLVSTRKNTGQPDIRRGLLLAAPNAWFARWAASPEDKWPYFLSTYQDLANAFGIVLGEIRTDELMAAHSQ